MPGDLGAWARAGVAPVVRSRDFGRVQLTHVNLNDMTTEGVRLLDVPAFSVQYHPEAAPGPHDARYLFEHVHAAHGRCGRLPGGCVARRARCGGAMIRSVLIPVDFTEDSRLLAGFASGLGTLGVDRAVLGHCVESSGLEGPVIVASVDRARDRSADVCADLQGLRDRHRGPSRDRQSRRCDARAGLRGTR